MDPRFEKNTLVHFRKKDWNDKKLTSHIEMMFKNTFDLLEGWEVIGVSWLKRTRIKKKEEIKSSSFKVLNVKVKNPKGEILTYNLKLPEIVKEQFFYIGGYLKIPIFQLHDFPIIYRKDITEGDTVKIKTNVFTISLSKNKTIYNIFIFNKKIPIEILLTALYEKKEFEEFYNTLKNPNEHIENIKVKCKPLWSTKLNERKETLGKYFSTIKNDYLKKANDILFSLKLAYNIDFFSNKFFNTDCVIKELLFALNEGTRKDTDLSRKRLRFTEYLLIPLMKQIYDMGKSIYGVTTKRNPKFQITQGIVLDNCNSSPDYNISDIIHFNLCVNPVGELASLFQCTLTGPGGFKKENVPKHLRTLDDSQFGYICPADTPDRVGCGVVLNLVPSIEINDNGTFKNKGCKDTPTSYSISLTPFLHNNDQTRLQMASNQAKQSLLLKDPDVPMIQSGTEDCYLDSGTFVYKAKDNGKVVHLCNEAMVLAYDNGEKEVIKPHYRGMYLNSLDELVPQKAEGRKFKKDEIVCSSKFIKDGKLSLGKNLLTGVGIWKGYNYEDAILISESAKKKFTSRHYVDLSFEIDPSKFLLSLEDDNYKPLPEIGQYIKRGEIYAKLAIMDLEKIEDINIEPYELHASHDCKISSIEIYPNFWNKNITEYDIYIQKLIVQQSKKYNTIVSKLKEYFNTDDLDKFITINGLSKLNCTGQKGKYTQRNQQINGILIKITAVYDESMQIGDKLANRHGNKGIVSKVLPDNLMPRLDDGRTIDIVLNPLGIISRMNLGQLYELTVSECLYNLKTKFKKINKKINSTENEEKQNFLIDKELKLLKDFLKICDKTESKWITKQTIKAFKKDIRLYGVDEAVSYISVIIPQFQGIDKNDLDKLIKLTKSAYKQRVYDPIKKIHVKNNLAAGYLYFYKLVHRANEKLSARSLGGYSKKTLQPHGGKSIKGGHRLGEMEVWGLKAHGADNFLKDLLTLHSDSIGIKNDFLSSLLHNISIVPEEDYGKKPQSLNLMNDYFSVLGLKIND